MAGIKLGIIQLFGVLAYDSVERLISKLNNKVENGNDMIQYA